MRDRAGRGRRSSRRGRVRGRSPWEGRDHTSKGEAGNSRDLEGLHFGLGIGRGLTCEGSGRRRLLRIGWRCSCWKSDEKRAYCVRKISTFIPSGHQVRVKHCQAWHSHIPSLQQYRIDGIYEVGNEGAMWIQHEGGHRLVLIYPARSEKAGWRICRGSLKTSASSRASYIQSRRP